MSLETGGDTFNVKWTDKDGNPVQLTTEMDFLGVATVVGLANLKNALKMSGHTYDALRREVHRAHAAERIEQKGNVLYMDHSVRRSEDEIVKIVLQSLYIYSKFLEQRVLTFNSEGEQL